MIRSFALARRVFLSSFLPLTLLAASFTTLPARAQTTPAAATTAADAAAYEAMARHDAEALRAARAQGGDPARYASSDPKALLDAAGPNRALATLAFVLASGAKPNGAPGGMQPPIFQALGDLEKIRLLVKAGADIDATLAGSGYTVLTTIVFDHRQVFEVPPRPAANEPARRYSKREMVQGLLDLGANPQGMSVKGGPRRTATLSMARRGENDIIDLLIARGAMLGGGEVFLFEPDKPRPKLGQVSLALMNDRDDIAAALLRHHRVIAPDDAIALDEAARRGFGEFALALLAAGANPNAAGSDRTTPLMWARKWRDKTLIAALLKAGAIDGATLPPFDDTHPGWNPFMRQVAAIVDEVAVMDSPRFTLDSPINGQRQTPFIMYGKTVEAYEQISCERTAAFSIIAFANANDHIQAGICHANAPQLKALAAGAGAANKRLLDAIGLREDQKARVEKMGWLVQEARVLPNGATLYETPVLAMGHGIAALRTVILVNRDANRAVIVQASLDKLCGRPDLRTPLCQEGNRALIEIAERVGEIRE